MTRPSLLGSWIDVEAAAAAAETLCPAPAPPPRAGFGSADFLTVPPLPEEEPDTAPPPHLHGKLAALRERAERNGLVQKSPADEAGASEWAAFTVPLGSVPVRMRALGDWLDQITHPASLFISDGQGEPLVAFRGGHDLLAAAAVLADAARKARRHLPDEADSAAVHLSLGPGQILSIVTAQTSLGTLHAGLTTPGPLPAGAVREIARALKTAAAGDAA